MHLRLIFKKHYTCINCDEIESECECDVFIIKDNIDELGLEDEK